MVSSSMRVGCVRSGSSTAEQRAAYDWCERTFPRAERFPVDALAEGDVDPTVYDVLWWHADDPIDPGTLAACRGPFERYLDGGGGLLLSLHALSAVEDLGIDAVAPDTVGIEHPPEASGFLVKSLHAEHPAFEAVEDLRVETVAAESRQPFARYERLVPERGDVLACGYRRGDAPHRKTLVSWEHGAGSVIGVGDSLAFEPSVDGAGDARDAADSDEWAANRSRLAEGVLTFLAGEAAPPLTTRPRTDEEFAALRRSLRADPNRPTYHLTPPANWCNDPNGLIEHEGTYHVFYQYNPAGPFHGTIHWGHAASEDLVHWEDRPVALAPSPDGPDAEGCWSGCAVLDGGTPTLIYTGGRDRHQLPCRATATDEGLDSWRKDLENPVIGTPPEDLDLLSSEHWEAEFRDHCIWQDGERWHHLIGSGIAEVGGTVLLYESPDLREWRFRSSLFEGDWEGAGRVWECPELLDLGDKALLHVSDYDSVPYFLGRFDPESGAFEREQEGDSEDGAESEGEPTGLLDYGDFYAPQSMRTDDGRVLTWGWVVEARPPERQWDAGWSGALSLPRELSSSPDERLEQRPARELEALRDRHVGHGDLDLGAESRDLDVTGTSLEIAAEISLEEAEFELVVRESPDGEERTPIRYTGAELLVDREDSSLDPEVTADAHRIPLESEGEDADDSLSLRVFLDGSILEAFANDRHCLTSRIYPTRSDSTGVSIGAIGGRVSIEALDVWQLKSAWPVEDGPDGRPAPRSSR